ncbi:MAG: AbiH family protein [Bacteroidia bacterium]
MNKLVIIGNGFDLAHGLKTRYSDFFLWYLKDVMNEVRGKFHYADDLISLSTNSISSSDISFKSLAEFKQKNFRVKPKSELFNRLINNSDTVKWVDIEAEYYALLTSIYKKIDFQPFLKDEKMVEVRNLNASLRLIKAKLEKYLLTIDHQLSGPHEEIAEHFETELSKAPDNSYGKSKIVFLNFNYTSTAELYLKGLKGYSVKLNYIHGKLGKPENPLIFGYGDEIDEYYSKIENLNSNEFLEGFKSFGYAETDNYQNLVRFINEAPFYTYIMGHSCGLSDRILFNSIFENVNCKSIKIFYYQMNESESDFTEKVQEISRHFKPAGKEKMRTIIVPRSQSVPLITFKPF